MKMSPPGKTLFILCVVALVILSCRTASMKSCPIENLLIDTSDLPGSQWEEVGSRSYRDAPSKIGIERIGTGFSTPYSGVAGENVYRFRKEDDAKTGFVDLADVWGRLEPEGTEWSQLELPSQMSISANEYRLDCSVSEPQNVKTCWYLARYKATLIEFRTNMIVVKDNDLFNIIEKLDQKVEKCNESK